MLCDITQVHTGFLFSPKVIGVEDDKDWGQIGSSKKILVAPMAFTQIKVVCYSML